MAWDETRVWLEGETNNLLYQNMLDDAATANERNSKRKKVVTPDSTSVLIVVL